VPTVIAPVSSGTLIDGTICGSPAAAAGMTAGSVITAINEQAVGSPASLASILARFKPGASSIPASRNQRTPASNKAWRRLAVMPA
jgi:S1-C subfamily serine protease